METAASCEARLAPLLPIHPVLLTLLTMAIARWFRD